VRAAVGQVGEDLLHDGVVAVLALAWISWNGLLVNTRDTSTPGTVRPGGRRGRCCPDV